MKSDSVGDDSGIGERVVPGQPHHGLRVEPLDREAKASEHVGL